MTTEPTYGVKWFVVTLGITFSGLLVAIAAGILVFELAWGSL